MNNGFRKRLNPQISKARIKMNEVRENFQQSFDQGVSPNQTILRLENKGLVTGNIRV
jgi:hypothetical protein